MRVLQLCTQGGGWWTVWSIHDMPPNEWRRYEFTLPLEVPTDSPVALRFSRMDSSGAGVLLLDNLVGVRCVYGSTAVR